ncbi:MAG: polysaccharide deacetylase family protein [Candidatus Peribacteraceae bacterium]|jgi:peptidoglycan/xylan/chitin deacetylase (PgdA/CDA1 family)
MLFTTSWDDGYALDLRLAELLERHGCTGTFYVSPQPQHKEQMLTEEEIRTLAARHEVGAHTLTHPKLTQLISDEARREISGSKEWVERVSGKPCTMFCYPYGDANEDVQTLVREAGFAGARATDDLRFSADDPFALPVTLQVMPFPWRRRFRPAWKILDPLGPLRARFTRLRTVGVPLSAMTSWQSLARALFTAAREHDRPFFHLYGHSREIERYGMWEQLDAFLSYIGAGGATPVRNSEVLP